MKFFPKSSGESSLSSLSSRRRGYCGKNRKRAKQCEDDVLLQKSEVQGRWKIDQELMKKRKKVRKVSLILVSGASGAEGKSRGQNQVCC